MNEKTLVEEVEGEGIEVVDLGDAAVETRQWHPSQLITDSALVLGRSFFE